MLLACFSTGALSFTVKTVTEEKCATSIRREACGKGQGARNISPLATSLSPKPPFEGGTSLADIDHQRTTINSNRRQHGAGN
jgi:hypothetical protein